MIFDCALLISIQWYTCPTTGLACRNQVKGIIIPLRIRFRTTTLHWLAYILYLIQI